MSLFCGRRIAGRPVKDIKINPVRVIARTGKEGFIMAKERKEIEGYPQGVIVGEKAIILVDIDNCLITSPVVSIGYCYSVQGNTFLHFETENSVYELKIINEKEVLNKAI